MTDIAKNEFDNILCSKIIWIGESDITNEFNLDLICTNRSHKFSLKQNSIDLDIEIIAKHTTKQVTILSMTELPYKDIMFYLFEILRFENLFDGRFFSTLKLIVDEKEENYITKEFLPYYRSKKKYLYIGIIYDSDDEYKCYFEKWLDVSKKYNIIHQMFLYASYAEDITPDVKLALLLQTFEPIADMLYENGKLHLEKPPIIIKSAECESCGNTVSVSIKNKDLHFDDRLLAIMMKYGDIIFLKEDRKMLVDMAVKTRNKIVHLDTTKINTMIGEQSGVYLYKFALLYRIIVFDEIQLNDDVYRDRIDSWVEQFDNMYIKYLITNDELI